MKTILKHDCPPWGFWYLIQASDIEGYGKSYCMGFCGIGQIPDLEETWHSSSIISIILEDRIEEDLPRPVQLGFQGFSKIVLQVMGYFP